MNNLESKTTNKTKVKETPKAENEISSSQEDLLLKIDPLEEAKEKMDVDEQEQNDVNITLLNAPGAMSTGDGANNSKADVAPSGTNPKTKLNGARGRRYKWLRKQGVPADIAKIQCLVHIADRETTEIPTAIKNLSADKLATLKRKEGKKKRNRSDTNISPRETKKVRSGSTPIAKKPSYSNVANQGILLGLIPANYPTNRLNDADINQIRRDLMKLIYEQRDGPTKPKFTQGVSARTGWAAIHCANEATVQWVNSQRLWADRGFQVLPEDQIPRSYTVVAYIKNSLEDDSDFILGVIKGSNENLDTTEWRVVHRKDDTDANLVVLTIDICKGSLETIKTTNFQIDYGVGQRIKLRLISRESKPRSESKTNPPSCQEKPSGPGGTSTPAKPTPANTTAGPSRPASANPGKPPTAQGSKPGTSGGAGRPAYRRIKPPDKPSQ
jgi:hypothetical protein